MLPEVRACLAHRFSAASLGRGLAGLAHCGLFLEPAHSRLRAFGPARHCAPEGTPFLPGLFLSRADSGITPGKVKCCHRAEAAQRAAIRLRAKNFRHDRSVTLKSRFDATRVVALKMQNETRRIDQRRGRARNRARGFAADSSRARACSVHLGRVQLHEAAEPAPAELREKVVNS